MIKLAAFTKGINTPSARFRVRQLTPHLEKQSIKLNEFPALYSSYPRSKKFFLPFMAGAAFAARVPDVIKGYGSDISLLQREMFSTIITLEPLVKRPIILDVDDAIFLRRQGKSARKLAQLADQVICGNAFIAEFFQQFNSEVNIIPTAIDTERYMPVFNEETPQKKVVGWIGSKTNFKYLLEIVPALEEIIRLDPTVRIRIVAEQPPPFPDALMRHVDFVYWTAEGDVAELQKMTVGIMPLADGKWERGKCSFKMLQYMACGLPVVVSPVGMNNDVLKLDELGLGAISHQDWVGKIMMLLNDPALCLKMGQKGRSVVEEHFSLVSVAADVSRVVKKLA